MLFSLLSVHPLCNKMFGLILSSSHCTLTGRHEYLVFIHLPGGLGLITFSVSIHQVHHSLYNIMCPVKLFQMGKSNAESFPTLLCDQSFTQLL